MRICINGYTFIWCIRFSIRTFTKKKYEIFLFLFFNYANAPYNFLFLKWLHYFNIFRLRLPLLTTKPSNPDILPHRNLFWIPSTRNIKHDKIKSVNLNWEKNLLKLTFFPRISERMPLAKDLLHPLPADERRKCKLKRLVQHPNSYFMDVKCPGCYK